MFQVNRSGAAGRVGRLLLAAAGSLVAVGTATVAPASAYAQATPLPLALPSLHDSARSGHHLTITVRNAGDGHDGTYELYCHPGDGDHPDVAGACAALDRGTRWGTDAFAPVPKDTLCTMQYGGPATAHVTGTWAGRPVDARYDRADGCQIGRWNRLVPVLPDVGQEGRA
ncbi:SSI family serine proteinase inhibitor [Streptomyces sp. NPDC051243]|uniref:SSI family serine proteinase inhibitor n=1 Tax=Streptomyces sp. NPDC051243 TaxID=3365646 RepID=UPI003797612E